MVWVGVITLIYFIGISITIHGRLARLKSRLAKGQKRIQTLELRRAALSQGADSAELEGQIARSKEAFNDSVLLYNASIEVFPSNVVAGMFRFRSAQSIA